MIDRLKIFLKRTSRFILAILLPVSILSYFSSLHMSTELLSHFRIQYLFVSLILTFSLVILKNFRLATIAVIVFCMNAYDVVSFFSQTSPHDQDSQGNLKLVLSNVHSRNKNYREFIDFVKNEQPDIFVALEVNQAWLNQLEKLKATYPYTIMEPRNDNFGIAAYGKTPFDDAKIFYIGDRHLPSIKLSSKVEEKRYTLIATHPVPPISPGLLKDRDQQLLALADEFRTVDTPKILIGDLNVTMWSDSYQQLEESTSMRNTRIDFGIMPTWPAYNPILAIPIDHCLVSKEFEVINMETGEDIGSDHLPIVVELGLR